MEAKEWISLAALVVSILSMFGFGTYVKTIFEDKKGKRKEETKKIVEDVIEPLKNDLDLLKNGEQASLRNDLLAKYKECSETGYRTIRDTQDWEDMYIAYHNLGGNSFIDQTKEDFERIPTEERYKVLHKEDKK